MANKVITGVARASYVHLVEPHAMAEGQEAKYSVSIIIPKDDIATIDAINKAIDKAIEEGNAKFGGKKIARSTVKVLRDGDEKDDPAYANCYYINAKSKDKPQIVDLNLREITDPDEVYSGMYARFSISFFAYSFNNMRGISCSLGNVQKVRDGERFGGKAKATTDFNDGYGASANDFNFDD